jgi:hypothetical protein
MDIQKFLCIKDSGYNTNITITDDNYCHQVQKKKIDTVLLVNMKTAAPK